MSAVYGGFVVAVDKDAGSGPFFTPQKGCDDYGIELE